MDAELIKELRALIRAQVALTGAILELVASLDNLVGDEDPGDDDLPQYLNAPRG